MIARIIDTFLGCWHNRYSFPLTVHSRSRSQAAALTGTYVVCLDCGRELPYDWNEMKVVRSAKRHRSEVRALAAKEAA
jgi:hypothetical protein